MIYSLYREGISFEFTSEVLTVFREYRQILDDLPESGGQLFAEFSESGSFWRICKATVTEETDERTRFFFRPNRSFEQKEIDRLYEEGIHYVGDWHTHPQLIPVASAVDIKSIGDTVAKSIHELPGFLLVIVGTGSFPRSLWASFHFPDKTFELSCFHGEQEPNI